MGLKLQIKTDGLDIIIGAIKRFVEEADFKEDVSDEYKNGFYDFYNAVIDMLEKLKNEDYIRYK